MSPTDLPPPLPGVPALELRLLLPEERPRFDQLLCERHYLHDATLMGESLRYVAVAPDRHWLALLAWCSSALHPGSARRLARRPRSPRARGRELRRPR
ncbi:MAG TPA: hypothetical protein VGA56_24295, partial [Opitutaceae bacterium]